MEEALFLTRYATQVHLIHRRDAFRASKIMQRRVVEHPKITIHYNAEVTDVLGENVVEGVQLRDTQTGETSSLPVQGLFVAIGHQPNTGAFKGILEMDERGYLKLKAHTMSSVALGQANSRTVIESICTGRAFISGALPLRANA